jgi:hypothetical protein
VYYFSSTGRVREAGTDESGGWYDVDITSASGGPSASLASGIAAEPSSAATRVYYVHPTGHLLELAGGTDGWTLTDITSKTDVFTLTSSALTSIEVIGDPHVTFVGPDDHLHEAVFQGGTWSDNDLTNGASGVRPSPDTQLAGLIAGRPASGNARVYYINGDSTVHLHQFALAKNEWSDSDLSDASQGVLPSPTGGIAAFAVGGHPRVYHVGVDGHLHETGWDGSKWYDIDITAAVTVSGNAV